MGCSVSWQFPPQSIPNPHPNAQEAGAFGSLADTSQISLFYSLQLSTSGFPKPLTEEEERRCLALSGQGDVGGWNILAERSHRYIVNKGSLSVADKRGDFVRVPQQKCDKPPQWGAALKLDKPGRSDFLPGLFCVRR